MFRIRHYDKYIHPDHFQKGVLGLSIRTLNYARWKLETFTQRLVLRYLNKEAALDEAAARKLEDKFELDVAVERVEKKRTSPLAPFFAAEKPAREDLRTAVPDEHRSDPPTIDDGRRQPSASLDDLAARYGHNQRSKRYAKGRSRFTVYENFEPVAKEEWPNE